MAVSSASSKNLEAIHQKVMKKIQNNKSLCQKGEEVIKTWQFEGRPIHAGQIKGTKILPNGNKQVRITTAYAGNTPTIATDTHVYSPSGELLNVYHGVRKPSGTLNYGNTPTEVTNIIKTEKSMNPELRYLS